MFRGCTNLLEPPELPAIELENYCYQNMFYDCKKLTRMPELPAVNAKYACYDYMFNGCSALTETTRIRTRSTVSSYSHRCMFNNCSNLSLIRCDLSAFNATNNQNWVASVAASGIYVKNPSLTDSFGTAAIPSGWTVKSALKVGNNSFTQVTGTTSFHLNCTCSSSSLVFTSDDIPSAFSLSSDGTVTNISAVENQKYTFHVTATPTDTDICPETFNVFVTYRSDILKFKAVAASSSIGFGSYQGTWTCDNYFYYSLDNGVTWTEYVNPASKTVGSCTMISVPNGSSILFRGVNNNFGYASDRDFQFRMTGQFEASGNIMSLIGFNEMKNQYCFGRLFLNCTSLLTGPDTPAMHLTERCYQSLYNGCTNLRTVGELPATVLRTNCYESIFKNCNSLESITVGFDSWSNATTTWCEGITNKNGTFVIRNSTLPEQYGSGKIPTGWTVIREP